MLSYPDARKQMYLQAYNICIRKRRQHSLTKARLRSNLIIAYRFLKSRCKNAETISSQLWQMEKEVTARLVIKRKFTKSLEQCWNRLPMDDMDILGSFQDLTRQTNG